MNYWQEDFLGEIPKYLTISKYDVSVKKESKDKINSFAKAHILVDGKEIVVKVQEMVQLMHWTMQ